MYTQVWLIGFLASVILFQLVSVPALLMRKNDLADVLWGPGFPLSAYAAVAWGREGSFSSLGTREWIALALVSAWGFRLFFHVGLRNLSHRAEDIRYNNWRKEWGSHWLWRSYLQVFVLQALFMFVINGPVLLSLSLPSSPLGILGWLGTFSWAIGFVIESVSDEQLRRFRKDRAMKGKLMTTGLWSWSRHPNYFGEVVQWWGIWLLALELPYGWATLPGPLAITYLILKVSGVPMLEKLMESRPGFEDYRRRTSEFFPRPPLRG
jgi:steroid 5-alpha reductase family enzyme